MDIRQPIKFQMYCGRALIVSIVPLYGVTATLHYQFVALKLGVGAIKPNSNTMLSDYSKPMY